MSSKNLKVNIAVILACMVMFMMVSAVFFIAHESVHECEGEDCPVCEMLQVFENILYRSDAGNIVISAAFVMFCLVAEPVFMIFTGLCDETPVSRKVRMDT